MKKNKTRGLLGLVVCLGILIFSVVKLQSVPDLLQYLFVAPAPVISQAAEIPKEEDIGLGDEGPAEEEKPNLAIEDLQKRLKEAADTDWQTAIETYSVEGIISSANFSSDKGGGNGRLTAIGEHSLQIYPLIAREGRLIYPEEFKRGDPVALIDEQLALGVFSESNPVGKTMMIQGEPYRVIGVVRHQKKVGDEKDYGAYVPLNSFITKSIPLDALMISARPIQGSGAGSTFLDVIQTQMQLRGTFTNLQKEVMGVKMPLRVMLFALGLIIMLAFIKWWNKRVLAFIDDYKRRLKIHYALRLLPRLIIGIAILFLGYILVALALAKLVQYILLPVYTFPEWIPEKLVAWSEIKKSFWNVWQGQAKLIEIRSPQLLFIRFFGFLISWGTGGFSLFLMYAYYEKRKQIKNRDN